MCLFCHQLKAISVITFSVVRHQSRDSYELKASNKAMSSTSSYGSFEASEAADQRPRRRRIVGAVAVALSLGLAIATFSLATPVASSAELIHGSRREN